MKTYPPINLRNLLRHDELGSDWTEAVFVDRVEAHLKTLPAEQVRELYASIATYEWSFRDVALKLGREEALCEELAGQGVLE